MEKLNITEAIKLINSQVSSIYTKSDVITLLERLKIDSIQTQGNFIEKVRDLLPIFENCASDIMENVISENVISDYVFCIEDSNKIQLDYVDLDHRHLTQKAIDSFTDMLDQLEENLMDVRDNNI